MPEFIVRVVKYTFVRLVILVSMVAASIYAMIFVANLGGYVDEVVRSDITQALAGALYKGWLEDVSDRAERDRIVEETRLAMEDAAGLNQPFLLRCLRSTWKGLTLDWGLSKGMFVQLVGVPQRSISAVILDRLPRTLLIFGVANFLLLCSTVLVALSLARRYGGWMDRLVTLLSPMAAVPGWTYGLILMAFSIRLWHTGYQELVEWPREFNWAYIPLYARYMFPPILAIFLSKFFQSVYTWRTFFLIHSTEDYVDLVRAKGLNGRLIERRYILRPALPGVLTSFALLIISLWQDVILLEKVFLVEGVGSLFYDAIKTTDVGLIVGLVAMFAYLLAITVFVLDIAYALVDPRVKIGGESQSTGAVSFDRKPGWWRGARKQPSPSISREAFRRAPADSRLQLPATGVMASSPLKATPLPMRQRLSHGLGFIRQMAHSPSIATAVTIIAVLIAISIYTVIAIPYPEAVRRWRGDHAAWIENPSSALPAWTNLFRKDKLPETLIVDSHNLSVLKTRQAVNDEMAEISLVFPVDYPYAGGFPQDWALYFDVAYHTKRPHVFLTWVTPDGREMELGSFSVAGGAPYYPFQDQSVQHKLKTEDVRSALFADPSDPSRPLTGHYELRLKGYVFEKDADLYGRLVIYGQVYGLAGTDSERRDVMLALLWGTPVALAFGLLAAVGTSLSTMFIAAIGAWFGGRVDGAIQWLAEVNMLIPFFPMSLMIYTLYSKSFWVILGVTVLLGVFGSGLKNYRAIFMQIREAPYIEAACSYGAGNWRIIFRYLIPRVGSTLIPQLVMLVPSYVFLEAALRTLGLYDPLTPPTWGQLMLEGLSAGVYNGAYHLILEPTILLVLTGVAFLLLGSSLERILEPRLREL